MMAPTLSGPSVTTRSNGADILQKRSFFRKGVVTGSPEHALG